jgi:hypothetical protein
MFHRIRSSRLFWRVLLPQVILLLTGTLVANGVVFGAVTSVSERTYLLRTVAVCAVAGLFLAFALSSWITRRLTRTFRTVAEALERLGGDDRPALPSDELDDEAAELGRTIGQVQRRMAARISQLGAAAAAARRHP